jgi:Ca-activated chloride channel family protein
MKRRYLLLPLGLAIGLIGSPAIAELDVGLTSPAAGVPIFGEVEMVAEVFEGDGSETVEFYVDGFKVDEKLAPPYKALVDVGEENREHRFEVRVVRADGASATSVVVSPSFRVDIEVDAELQQLYVTVLNDGRRVLDLEETDFEIRDRRQDQKIVTFARGDVRVTASLLIDASASMEGRRIEFALNGARAFVQGLKDTDDVSIDIFSDRLLYLTDYSNDIQALTAGFRSVRAEGGTALNDHLYMALKRLEQRQGRRVVVVLSDGYDSHSALRMREITWLARRSRAMIYWIRLGFEKEDKLRYSAWKDPKAYEEEFDLLVRTVAETGGRIIDLAQIEQTSAAMGEIVRELREQYVLGYYPTIALNDDSWHSVQVKVDRPGVRVRTRGGYIDY